MSCLLDVLRKDKLFGEEEMGYFNKFKENRIKAPVIAIYNYTDYAGHYAMRAI